MKKSTIITIIMIIVVFLINIPTYSKAVNMTDVFSEGDGFLNAAQGNDIFDPEKEEDAVNTAYWIMLGIAIAAAVIIGMVLGIQFITSGVTGQAKVKEKLIPYGVGCVVAFGAFGIWRIVLNLAENTF